MDRLRRGDLIFDVVDGGPPDGPPVLLLHGFPQTAAMWAEVAGRLQAQGCRTLAPCQRGYSPGARPARVKDYRLTELVADAVAFSDGLGRGPVHVVGHDWGGEVAWMLAAWHPEKVKTLTVVSAPHLAAFALAATRSRQGLASWYIGFFQVPGLVERLFDPSTAAGRRRFVRFLAHYGHEPGDAERDAVALGRDGLRGGLAWYRALPREPWSRIRASKVVAPTLMIWSDRDRAVRETGFEMSRPYVSGPCRFEVLPGVSHWIPNQAPDRLAELILEQVDATR